MGIILITGENYPIRIQFFLTSDSKNVSSIAKTKKRQKVWWQDAFQVDQFQWLIFIKDGLHQEFPISYGP